MLYPFLRVYLIPVAFVLWLLYQLIINDKKFSEIKNDVITVMFFMAVWYIIFFLFLA